MSTKKLLQSKKFARLIYKCIRLYSKTFRLSVINEKPWRDHLANGGRVLICTWHQQFFSLIRYYQTYKTCGPSLMISQSADGELIANVANFSGWYTVRGSSTRGGGPALEEIVTRLKKTGLAAHILDGPKGPAGIVKPGAVHIAIRAGAMMVPVYAEAESKWIFNSWDRFFIPKPFSNVTIRYGDMLPPPAPGSDLDELEKHRKCLENFMQQGLII